MQIADRLDGPALAAAAEAFRDALRSHRDYIDRLNVYPVPDGDTGTNMALTAESVVAEIERQGSTDLGAVAQAMSYGSLMGARGNSGVILSQILRGLSETFRGLDHVDAETVAEGLRHAGQRAYDAVQNPVEGTILTVARAAGDGASCVDPREGLVAVLEAASSAARTALERTPDQLPVLKAAGVVDSGGSGFVLLLDALLHAADGRPMPVPPGSPPRQAPRRDARAGSPVAAPGSGSDAVDLRYEVMYLLEAPDDLVPAFREVWAGIGDSIVVVGGDGLWNCHIHTDDVGAAIEAALEAGRPRKIRVTDLREEVEEEKWVRAAEGTEAAGDGPEDPVVTSVVAVCNGDGVRRIFRSLGVHHVVGGGQSMNPSTAEILEAIEATNSDQVVVLPNNKNIVPVARQAAREASKPVVVVETKGIQEGFAALLEYDPQGDAEANGELMARSAARVVAGEVTRAVRPSVSDAGPIREGDFLGISRERIEVVAPDVVAAATGLLGRLVDPQRHEIVTVIAGEGSTVAATRRISQWLAESLPGVETEVHQGGQPLYPYLFSVE